MPEITVKIEAPELTAALNRLADAFGGKLVQSAPTAPTAPSPAVPVATQPPAAPPASVPMTTQPPAAPPPTVPTAPPPTVPTAPPPSYTLEQLLAAGGQLMDKGPQAVQQLQGLLAKYAVMKVSDLQPAQYGAFATDLRGLGVQI